MMAFARRGGLHDSSSIVGPMFIEHSSPIWNFAFAVLEGYHHEEDVIGSRCSRDFGCFRSLVRLCWSAHLSRTRWLSVLVGLCRCPGWRAGRPLLLAYRALVGWSCLARAPRAPLLLIRSRCFGASKRRATGRSQGE